MDNSKLLNNTKAGSLFLLGLAIITSSKLKWYHTSSLGNIIGIKTVWGIAITIILSISFLIVLTAKTLNTIKWGTALPALCSFIIAGLYILNVLVFTKNLQSYIADYYDEYVHLMYGVYVCFVITFITFLSGISISQKDFLPEN